jgi:creatinine amidohydrolase/Fe(II)-dependent formamide hydrolase-like protein/7-cyano-7-deazaguanine synthase in queuosine biosynthesis
MKENEHHALQRLKVIDRFEIGPVRLEKRRLVCPYSITQKGKKASYSLIYRYQEDVFNPDEYDSAHLADMIAAQVAMNYGMFCSEMVYYGLYDEADQRFIQDMMMNTAREIYVKKFLEPNPFLKGIALGLPVIKQDSYVQARVIFDSNFSSIKGGGEKTREKQNWKTAKSRYAVLSSGGKDSLLSFGLLHEIGREVHPIFVNESGRHWYTALNAFRHFSSRYSRTSRVWTNCDRMFNWMIRHFPFIRQDFADIRSDEYPIRLWTVAVFLFGALPLLHKRGIGRLVIGDEFDTTSRKSFKGITHYDGLFDQSRYFDNYLTRYFIKKGWNITQFSLLRPLSELLIEKILSQRYPGKLQKYQMSCHATHIRSGRVYPCGQCEKCRRIVGMLVALGTDPKNCGYTDSQIKNCLDAITAKGVHQESAGADQLRFLLSRKGLLSPEKKIRATEHREIMKVRIDPERSPIEAVPVDIREPMLRIFLEHAEGAAKRQGRLWVEYDPLNDPALSSPYPFELPSERSLSTKNGESDSHISSHILGELTWPEAQARFKEVDVALLPVGSLEQHGLHLPLDTDAFDAYYLARQVAQSCSDPRPLVLPLIPYGVSYHHDDFSGTIKISPQILSQLTYEIGISAAKNGITKLVIINGHGGNIPALQFAAQMINRDAHIFTCVETGETSERDVLSLIDTPNDVHAGEIETSTSLAIRPHMVRRNKMRKFIPRFSSRYLNFSTRRSVEWNARIAKISPSGVLGDPTKASKEKGKKIWAVMIKHLVEFVEDLKNMSLDEIYQKRL